MEPLHRRERAALSDTLAAVGPDAPTLCAGWSARDLAAHLVLRERRLDAAAGIVAAPLAWWTQRVQDGYAARDYGELVRLVRTGPPLLSPYALPTVDKAANTVELFVHHEDVRRARHGWRPRELPAATQEALWRRVQAMGRFLVRKAPAGVTLRRPDGWTSTVRPGDRTVTVVGEPAELLLFAHGRQRHAQVRLEGDEQLVAATTRALFGV
jgi:uncharacterized protein (TIGR03085 family)